jgi:predicted aspartyl protease
VRAVTLKVPVVTNGKEVKAVIDTGAEVTVNRIATNFVIKNMVFNINIR